MGSKGTPTDESVAAPANTPGVSAGSGPSTSPELPPGGTEFVPRCPRCDYILIGLTEERCPECGRRFSLKLLREAQLRRKPTPMEDPSSGGGPLRRYLRTVNAVRKETFYLFLHPADRSGPAIGFAAVGFLLVLPVWLAAGLYVINPRVRLSLAVRLAPGAPAPTINSLGVLDPDEQRLRYVLGPPSTAGPFSVRWRW